MTAPDTCLRESVALDFVHGLDALACHGVEEHLASCAECRALVLELARDVSREAQQETKTEPGEQQTRRVLATGTRIGRYVIVDCVGIGGMGVVYAAFDAELDRKVALKFWRATSQHEQRLRREAKILARLSHPNVVGVYEIGKFDQQAFVVMEFVEGLTLKEWLATKTRTWRQVVEIFLAAGRGLAVAHEAGILHRDFKPENVLIGDDQRVRVADFGLASWRIASDDDARTSEYTDGSLLVTRAGGLLGTLVYMSPEQLRGEELTPASDLFNYCVALYEALYGERPFSGATPTELLEQIVRGEVRSNKTEARVPNRLRRILIQGLSPESTQRYSSMQELLADIVAQTSTEKNVKGVVAMGGIAVASVALLAMSKDKTEPTCDRGKAIMEQTWGDSQRRAARAGFLGSSLGAFERVESQLDNYAKAWRSMHEDTCRATRVSGDQSESLLDLRMQCLERKRSELGAFVEILSSDDTSLLSGTMRGVSGLSPVDACANLVALQAVVPPPINVDASRLGAMRKQIDRAIAKRLVGQYDEALVIATTTVAEAQEVGYQPLLGEALYWQGELEGRTGDYEKSEENLVRAGAAALAGRDFVLAARAWSELAFIVGYRSARMAEGIRWGEQALAALEPIPGADDVRGKVHARLGSVYSRQEERERSIYHQREAIGYFGKVYGANHPSPAAVRMNMAIDQVKQGDYEKGLASLREVYGIFEEFYGPEHPLVAHVLNSIAHALKAGGKPQEALEPLGRSLKIRKKTLGPSHPMVADSLMTGASIHKVLRNLKAAGTMYEDALAIRREALGNKHAHVGVTLAALGRVRKAEGKLEEALALFQEGVEILKVTYGDSHHEISIAISGIAGVKEELGLLTEAIALHREALAMEASIVGATSPELLYPLGGLARALEKAGKFDEALAILERRGAITNATFGVESANMAIHLSSLATLQLARGDFSQALEGFEETLRLDTKFGSVPEDLLSDHVGASRALNGLKRYPEALQRLEAVRSLMESANPPAQLQVDFDLAVADALWATGSRKRAVTLVQSRAEKNKELRAATAWLGKHVLK